MMRRLLALFVFTLFVSWSAAEIPPVRRILPPPAPEISVAERAALEAELSAVSQTFAGLPKRRENANAEVFIKAVRYAVELGEFYKPGDTARARDLLAEARRRMDALRRGEFPWLKAKGLVVRGYYSPIDGSPQPFGLEIPDDAPAAKAPAWIWLRGRADTGTDLHFITERMKKKGQFSPPGCVVVHPFGRHCTGYKNAGEQDVLDVAALLGREGLIDPQRLALAGFSMGGAGAWLLGAHYPDHRAVVHTGTRGLWMCGVIRSSRRKPSPPRHHGSRPSGRKTMCPPACATCSMCRSFPTAARRTSSAPPRRS
jgi:hypothetical protein